MAGARIYTGVQGTTVRAAGEEVRLYGGALIPSDIDEDELRELERRGLVGVRPDRLVRTEADPHEGLTSVSHRLGVYTP